MIPINRAHRSSSESALQSVKRRFLPPPKILVSEWAEGNRVLSDATTSFSGNWRNSRTPYLVEPMDSVLDPDVFATVMMVASQTGKSECCNNIIGYHVEHDPCPMLMVQPTVDRAEEYSKDRLEPMFRESPSLKAIVGNTGKRTGDIRNTILDKSFPGGNLTIAGANAPSGLASKPKRGILADEIDRFPDSAGREGNPLALAMKRTESYPDAFLFLTSTPTIKGFSEIENWFDRSDKRRWFWPCPACGHQQFFVWGQVKWEEDEPATARYHCEECDHPLDDHDRLDAVNAGRWVATAESKDKIRGYHYPGIGTPFPAQTSYEGRLHQMVAEHLARKAGGSETFKVWVNTFLAETYEEQYEQTEAKVVSDRVEPYTPEKMPEGVLFLTAGVDVQGDRLEYIVTGWGYDWECWAIETAAIYGDPTARETWAQLFASILHDFVTVDGRKLRPVCTFVDSGYRQEDVFRLTKPHRGKGVFPCKGFSDRGANARPLLANRPSVNNKSKTPQWIIGTRSAKLFLYDRLSVAPGGPRTFHFAEGYGFDEGFFAQLTAEKVFTRHSFGRPYRVVENTNRERNEALDIMVYAMAAAHRMNPDWDKLTKAAEKEKERLEKEPEKPPQGEPRKRKPAARGIRRKNFAGSW